MLKSMIAHVTRAGLERQPAAGGRKRAQLPGRGGVGIPGEHARALPTGPAGWKERTLAANEFPYPVLMEYFMKLFYWDSIRWTCAFRTGFLGRPGMDLA